MPDPSGQSVSTVDPAQIQQDLVGVLQLLESRETGALQFGVAIIETLAGSPLALKLLQGAIGALEQHAPQTLP